MHAHRFILTATLTLSTAVLSSSCRSSVETLWNDGSGGNSSSSSSSGDGGSSSGSGGQGGVSTGGCTTAAECASFGDACSEGACINGTCGKLPINEGGKCDDGKQCTQLDLCKAGVCVGGSKKSCTSAAPCMVGECDVATDTCIEIPAKNGSPCVDNDACTQTGFCNSGICDPGPQVDCSYLNGACTEGYCDPQLGCLTKPKNDGAVCDDKFFCTVNDHCTGGVCKGQPNTCAAPGNPCMVGSCDEALKTCVAVPGNNGVACEDGNDCTAGEKCSNGTCAGGLPTNNGGLCDDKNGCTGGTTCTNGSCGNPTSVTIGCVNNDMCCPAGCVNDNDCLYWVSGVQQNVPAASLVGWTPCYSDHYDNASTPMSQILNQCDKAKLLLACRPVGAASFTTLAMAPRADVLFDCGTQASCANPSNGVGWYYSDSYSWGFAPAGEAVSRQSCDTEFTQNGDRLCWHTGGGNINGGWRCGSTTALNADATWERLIFEAD